MQNKILRLLAANRSPDSYLAGATVIHRSCQSPRYSQDLDFFHDIEDSVAACAMQDAATLRAAGYNFKWLMQTSTFHRGIILTEETPLKLEWAQDSAFRFFPIQPDKDCGYRLHDADAATNKLLALAGRNEVRDFVDILHLDQHYLSLGAIAWAACGKDPGFTPEFLLDQANRHTNYAQRDVNSLSLRKPLDIHRLKRRWIDATDRARELFNRLSLEEIGCLYLDNDHKPVTPARDQAEMASLKQHYGQIHGAWPTLTPLKNE